MDMIGLFLLLMLTPTVYSQTETVTELVPIPNPIEIVSATVRSVKTPERANQTKCCDVALSYDENPGNGTGDRERDKSYCIVWRGLRVG